jgi:hypothetical protein
VRGEHRQQPQLGASQGRFTGGAGATLLRQSGLQHPGLAGQAAHVGPPLEQLVNLPDQGLCPREIAEGEIDADELNPRLGGDAGHRGGQQMPQTLSADEFLPRSRDIAPVQRGAGLDRADQGYRVALLDSGPTEHGACFSGQDLGLAPSAVGHRHQRLLA